MSDNKHNMYDYISSWLSDYNGEKFARWLYHKPELTLVYDLVKQWVEDENNYQSRPDQPDIPPESDIREVKRGKKLKDIL